MKEQPIFENFGEVTPCGALSMYTVDNRTDFVIRQTFGAVNPPKVSASKCQRCSWTGFCRQFQELDKAVKAGSTIDVLRVLEG